MDLSNYTITEPDLVSHRGAINVNEYWMAQNQHAPRAFAHLLSDVRPTRILELGTGAGGLTWFLKNFADRISLPVDILTYDINRNTMFDAWQSEGLANFRTENIWVGCTGYETGTIPQPEAIEFLRGEGTSLVLCDGGNKAAEFNAFSAFLKPGDIIMAHDYAVNRDVFLQEINGKLWNWCEITYAEVEASCVSHSLVSFMEDEFAKAVWLCKRKQG